MTTDQANMLLDSYYNTRVRRADIYRTPDASHHDRVEAEADFLRIRDTLVGYLRQVEFRS